MEKRNVAVLFGGRSPEHEVSCVSAYNIIKCIDRDKWNVIPVGIKKDGSWVLAPDEESVKDGRWYDSAVSAYITPDSKDRKLYITENGEHRETALDLIWPALHGEYGEDGTVQGLFEMAGIPYVGAGVLTSAVCMDKLYTKIIADTLHIRQAGYLPVLAADLKDMDNTVKRIEEKFHYPVFIKPARAGSSCGVSRADNRNELEKGLENASLVDSKMLVEEYIKGREIETAVLQYPDGRLMVSCPGEILSSAGFYDYDAKYNSSESKTIVGPELPQETVEELKKDALAIFRAVDGRGLSRVDFFVTEAGEVVFNEINTMPGFTGISMYPMLMAAEGIDGAGLAALLMENGLRRFE